MKKFISKVDYKGLILSLTCNVAYVGMMKIMSYMSGKTESYIWKAVPFLFVLKYLLLGILVYFILQHAYCIFKYLVDRLQ